MLARFFAGRAIRAGMIVVPVPCWADNYAYILADEETKEAAVVDPVEAEKVLKEAEKIGFKVTKVLTTHHHNDHAGGNADFAQLVPGIPIYGGDERILALTQKLCDGESVKVGNLDVKVLASPCHTTGHVLYYVDEPKTSERALFSGDTLFLGGCGRFFEGTADQMHNALNVVIAKLPHDTKVYCGHEYSVSNLKFAMFMEPDNPDVQKKYDWCLAQREKGLPTIPSTIGEELSYNPYMRPTSATIQEKCGTTDFVGIMGAVRELKNGYRS